MTALKRQHTMPLSRFKPKHIEIFCSALNEKLLDRNSNFGKEYLKLLISKIRFTGKEVFLQGCYSGVIQALQNKKLDTLGRVPSSVPCWLPSADSNHGQGG